MQSQQANSGLLVKRGFSQVDAGTICLWYESKVHKVLKWKKQSKTQCVVQTAKQNKSLMVLKFGKSGTLVICQGIGEIFWNVLTYGLFLLVQCVFVHYLHVKTVRHCSKGTVSLTKCGVEVLNCVIFISSPKWTESPELLCMKNTSFTWPTVTLIIV